jgi:hypothetical protein
MQNSLEIETGHWNKTICGEHTCICKLCSKDIGDEFHNQFLSYIYIESYNNNHDNVMITFTHIY